MCARVGFLELVRLRSAPANMAGHSRTLSPDSWQDEVDFAQRPPTSSTSDHSEHSFHSRSKSSAHITSPKRLSIFSRARSNTANLTSTTNRQLPTVPLSYGEPSVYPMPTDEKASDNATRSLLVRGSRILRRQGSKLNVAAPLEEEDELGKSAVRFEVSNLFHRTPKLKKNDSRKFACVSPPVAANILMTTVTL